MSNNESKGRPASPAQTHAKKKWESRRQKGYPVEPGQTWADLTLETRQKHMRDRLTDHLRANQGVGGLHHTLTRG